MYNKLWTMGGREMEWDVWTEDGKGTNKVSLLCEIEDCEREIAISVINKMERI